MDCFRTPELPARINKRARRSPVCGTSPEKPIGSHLRLLPGPEEMDRPIDRVPDSSSRASIQTANNV